MGRSCPIKRVDFNHFLFRCAELASVLTDISFTDMLARSLKRARRNTGQNSSKFLINSVLPLNVSSAPRTSPQERLPMSAVHSPPPPQYLFSGFAAYIGLTLREYSQAQTVITFELLPHHLNHAGNLHGGVIASLADTAMGMSGTWHADPACWRMALTLSLNINYIASVPPATEVRAVARVRGGGTKIFMAGCELLDAEGRLLASAEGVFKRGRLRQPSI